MSHWAEIDEEGCVVRVLVGDNGTADEGYGWLIENLGGTWVKTSLNTSAGVHYSTDDEGNWFPSEDQTKALRKNYAAVGFIYDEDLDAFIPPQPFESWILDEDTCWWEPPVPYPMDGARYVWDEETIAWVEVEDV
jgi:hypothetical protein